MQRYVQFTIPVSEREGEERKGKQNKGKKKEKEKNGGKKDYMLYSKRWESLT